MSDQTPSTEPVEPEEAPEPCAEFGSSSIAEDGETAVYTVSCLTCSVVPDGAPFATWDEAHAAYDAHVSARETAS